MRVFLFIAVLMVVFLFPTTGLSESFPELSIDQAEYDFGEVFQGEKVTHTFSFSNSGKAPLVINRLKSSCGCTAALLSSKNIAPGETGTIKATFDSSRFRGPVQKAIYLFSNLPGKEKVQFTVKGKVKPVVEYSPTLIDFGAVREGEEKQLGVVVKNAGEGKLKINSVGTYNTALSATAAASELLSGAETELTVLARPIKDTLNLKGYVLIRTDNKALGEVRIPVRGVVER